MKEAEEN